MTAPTRDREPGGVTQQPEPSRLRRILLRRWYLVMVGLLMTGGLAFAASIAQPVTYEATATMLILPPTDPTGNPYLALSGYGPFADVFARAMMDTSSVADLRAKGVTDQFAVTRDVTTSAPIVQVSVTGKDADAAVKQAGIVAAALPTELVALQQSESVPVPAMFTSKFITIGGDPTAIRKSQIRAVIAATAVGLILTVWATVWIDTRLRRRSSATGQHALTSGPKDTDPPAADAAVERIHSEAVTSGDEPALDIALSSGGDDPDPGVGADRELAHAGGRPTVELRRGAQGGRD